MFSEQVHENIRQHAERMTPQECCGFIINNTSTGKVEIFPCDNIAENKTHNFVINPLQMLEAERLGKILAYYHSHTLGDETPSMPDKINSQSTQLPSLIYSVLTKKFYLYTPDNFKAPLIGRPFVWGISDCFSLVYDYYRYELNIVLNNNYFRHNVDDILQNNYFEKDAETQGFQLVNQLQKHDILLMKIDAKVGNHVAIYLGNEQILHHPGPGKLSRRSFYGSYWKKITSGIYRHRTLITV